MFIVCKKKIDFDGKLYKYNEIVPLWGRAVVVEYVCFAAVHEVTSVTNDIVAKEPGWI